MEISVLHQPAGNRLIVHLISFQPQWRTADVDTGWSLLLRYYSVSDDPSGGCL